LTDAVRIPIAITGGAAGALLFLHGALAPSSASAALFAAAYLALVTAACVAPFLGRRGVLAFGAGATIVLLAATGGLWTAKLAAAAYVALFAATAAVMGRGVYRPAVCAIALLSLTTFFYWDRAFLFDAADRKQSAALAFALNPAAALSVTVGFDWMHAKALYSHSQTAESMFGIPLAGLATMATRTLLVLVPFAGIAWWKDRRA
jgi:hypothetical protein